MLHQLGSILKVGCIIVKDNRIIAQGYNGFLPNLEHKSKEIRYINDYKNDELVKYLCDQANIKIIKLQFSKKMILP